MFTVLGVALIANRHGAHGPWLMLMAVGDCWLLAVAGDSHSQPAAINQQPQPTHTHTHTHTAHISGSAVARSQRQRAQNLTSASGDDIWRGAHRHRPHQFDQANLLSPTSCVKPDRIASMDSQFGGIFFATQLRDPGTTGPPVNPRGGFYQTDFPPLSCSVLRGPASSPPSAAYPSGTPAGLTRSRWTPCAGNYAQEVRPSKNNGPGGSSKAPSS
jgi:hypothetical protein